MATIFCDPSATGSDDGSSWEDAYESLQDAIDNAASGDEVWVKGRTITLTARIDFDNSNANAIYGGFDTALTGTNGSVAGRDLPTDITILDGVATYQGGYVNNQEHTIDGFKFYNCDGTLGAGLQCYMTSGTVTVSNCIFDQNSGTTGGLYVSGGGTCDVDDCDFTDNDGTSNGGAFYFSSSSGTMDNCTFDGNSGTTGWGVGGITGSGHTLSMTDCDVTDNSTAAYNGADIGGSSSATLNCVRVKIDGHTGGTIGGAIRCTGTNTKFVNCVITNNSASYGGAMYLSGGTHTITNCTLADNTAGTGGSIRNTGGASTTLYNCIIVGNSTAIANVATMALYHCNYDFTWSGTGSDNVDDTPGFIGTGDDPYDLNATSDGTDAGDASATNYPSTDYLGRARVDYPGVTSTGSGTPDYSDMGAYELQVTDSVSPRPAMLLGY